MSADEQYGNDPDALEGMAWWNRLSRSQRAHWLDVADSAVPADAWDAFKRAGRLSGISRPGGQLQNEPETPLPLYRGQNGFRPGIDPASNTSILAAADEETLSPSSKGPGNP